jgi:GH35 family endo-1,4-beta-xylanase
MVLCIAFTLRVNAGSNDINHMIRQNRMGELTIKAKPGASVRVEQIRHEFWFGAAISSSAFSGRLNSEDERKYKEVFLSNFNAAVTENALKWHAMEPRKGQVNYAVVDAILKWTDENEIPLRGHNLFWGIPGRVQNWVKNWMKSSCMRHSGPEQRPLHVATRADLQNTTSIMR